ncbi:MAG: hypothetical protein KA535_11205 [Azonexus sp.]|nr:hypothetical protein [Azonexus sp.]
MQLKERREKALQMRIDGYSLRQIEAVVGIDNTDLCNYFKSYKSESIKALQEELFEMQSARLTELWRNAAEAMRKFVPVVDAKGQPILVPVLDADGQPVFDEAGQPITEYMRDMGVHLNAVNVATRVAEKLAAHFGTDGPAKTLMLSNNENRQITFRIVESNGDGRLLPQVATEGPQAMPDADGGSIGATTATEKVVGGVEVVSFDIDIPTTLPGPPLKYMD